MNKYFLTPLRQRFSTIWVSQEQLDIWMESWNYFFILGFGRSGTAFMANLLNHSPGAYVFHEPVIEDFYAHVQAHYSPQKAIRYIRGFRKREIYTRTCHLFPGIYGEVNGALRCHAGAIKEVLPRATLIHLVRDGRDVIRSHMSRRTMTIKHPLSISIHPTKLDPWKTNWNKMDRFSKICWSWQEENARLRKTVGRLVQFERILSSYDYFYNEVLEPCSIFIDKKDWEMAISTPRNTTSNFKMPRWEDWSHAQQMRFNEICGEEMRNCGYDK